MQGQMIDDVKEKIATDVPDDGDLIDRVRRHDDLAFAELVRRYSPRVHGLLAGMLRNSYDVEDAVQDVFFKVYRKLPEFEGKSSFFTWLYRVAVNTATDHLKRRRRTTKGFDDMPGFEPVAESDTPTEDFNRTELRRRMAEAMADLPEIYRNILVLREYEECSYEEIAEILDVAIGTVESRLFRARARLKEKLKKFMGGTTSV